MYYPEKLKNRRLELGLKQTELAKELGISKQSYFTWEKGTTQPTKANLAKLEELLQVPHGYFSELEIATLYKQLTDQNQEKALTYVQDLLEEQSKVVSIVQEPRFAYKVYERLSAGVGANIYDDMDYDTVYFDKDLALKSFMPEFGFGGIGGGKAKYEKVLPLPTAIYRDLAEWSKINTLYVPQEINLAKKMLLAAHEPEKVKRLLEILQNELGHTFLTAVEQTKIALTEKEKISIGLDFLSDAPIISADKHSFEDSLQNDVRKITKSVQECLLQAQAKPEDIELVVLTGGSTEIPYVQKIMCSQFANAELAQSNKLSSVGLGLAYDSMRKYA